MAARSFFSNLNDLFNAIGGKVLDYDGSGNGTWSGETFTFRWNAIKK